MQGVWITRCCIHKRLQPDNVDLLVVVMINVPVGIITFVICVCMVVLSWDICGI